MTSHKSAARPGPINHSGAWARRSYGPFEEVPVSGSYVCTGCMQEIDCRGGDKFPPSSHHRHGASACPVRWRLACGDG